MAVPGYMYPDGDGSLFDESVPAALKVVTGAVIVGVATVAALVCWAVDRHERRRR